LKGPTPRKLARFVDHHLRLKSYLRDPGDGRSRPQIRARDLLWGLLVGVILRENSFHAIQALVRSSARRATGVGRDFSDDSLGYFAERLSIEPTRKAMARTANIAKRNKAFDDCRLIGLAVDGTGAGACQEEQCNLCHPVRNEKKEIVSYVHHFCMASVIGSNMTLPVDVEPYAPGDCEYNAAQRLLSRLIANLGSRFADFVVGDGAFATAPFLHTAGSLGLRVIARLKGNLPELFAAAQTRFEGVRPHKTMRINGDRVELWDADDFDPWDTLQWTTVRVLRYRQHKPNGEVVEAYWLTDFPTRQVGSPTLFAYAKSRWKAIENQGFNVGKTYHGLEHIPRHHENALVIWWLLVAFAITIERLYRLRYLRRGLHQPRTAVEMWRLLRLALCPSRRSDSS
jgi:hypothetical protein